MKRNAGRLETLGGVAMATLPIVIYLKVPLSDNLRVLSNYFVRDNKKNTKRCYFCGFRKKCVLLW